MKKWALVLIVLLSTTLSGCDLLEDLDTQKDIEVDLKINDSLEATLEIGQELEFVFIVEDDQEVVVYLESDFDSVGEIRDEDGNLIAMNDDFYDLDFFINVHLEPGVYVIYVGGYEDEEGGDFTLYLEDDTSSESLQTLESTDYFENVESSIEGFNVYKVVLSEETYFSVVLFADGFVDLYVINAQDQLVIQGDFYEELDLGVLIAMLEEGTYYLVFEADYSVDFFDFTYTEIDHEVHYLSDGETVSDMYDADGVDIIEVSIDEAGEYSFILENSAMNMSLLTQEFEEVDYFVNTNNGGVMTVNLEVGTYYLGFLYNDQDEPYTVSLEKGSGTTYTNDTPLYLNTPISGTLLSTEEYDGYVFTISTAGTYTIYLESSFDSYGFLYDSNFDGITSDDDSGEGVDFAIVEYLSPGTYYVDVEGYDSSEYGSYTIYLKSGDHSDNTSTSDDTNLYLNLPINGFLYSTAEYDGYTFTITTSGTYSIYVDSTFDSYGTLYDSSFNIIGQDDDSAGNLDFMIVAYLSAGTYYVDVEGYDSSDYGSYTIYLKSGDQTPTTSSSDDITFGVPVSDYIGYDDYHFYQFTLYSTTTVSFNVISTFDSYGYLTDSDYNVIAEDDDSFGDLDFSITHTLSPGTYYIVVCGYDETETGSYTLYPFD